ncbi:MAG: hypothetical protein MK209_10005, partial [Planctomycetes bacterium]|nr:hypothetical protein [Planctomycetota bacterium]
AGAGNRRPDGPEANHALTIKLDNLGRADQTVRIADFRRSCATVETGYTLCLTFERGYATALPSSGPYL